jgi:ATP-dependent Clp protease ATP-binding subunit ClpA
MFDVFSARARQIISAARFKAGERGANTIDVNDFLVGLILGDQCLLTNVMSKLLGEPVAFAESAESHILFIPPKTAQNLPASMEKLLPLSNPVAPATSASISPALMRVFDSAKDLQRQLRRRSHIEPLHLLAAILTEESSDGVKLLQGYGITREKGSTSARGPAGD